MTQTIPNPLTRQAALHLVYLYDLSQTDEKPSWRRSAEHQFYTATKVLSAQGVPSTRKTSGQIVEAVIGAWRRHQDDPHEWVTTEPDLRGVLDHSVPWVSRRQLDAVNEVVAEVNAPVPCEIDDCDEPALDTAPLCPGHERERLAKQAADDQFLAEYLGALSEPET